MAPNLDMYKVDVVQALKYFNRNGQFMANSANQLISYSTNQKTNGNAGSTAESALIGGTAATVGAAAYYSEYAGSGKFSSAGNLASLGQVYYNHFVVNDMDYRKLTAGDLITVAGAMAFTPGLQWVALGLAIAGLAYSIYENKYGSITLNDIRDSIFGNKEAEIQATIEKLAEQSKKDQENGTHTPITPDELEKLLNPIFRDTFDLSDEEWDKLTKPLHLDPYGVFYDKNAVDKAIEWFEDNFDCWKNTDRSGNYHIYDPLILDLDGDGIETVGVDFKTASNNAYFDFDNDGRLNVTGWVKSDDGLLVRDINNNGVIDNGSEIFGDRTLKQNSYTIHNEFYLMVA